MKLKIAITFILLLASASFSQFTVHIKHPWANDPVRAALPVYIISPVLGPAFPGTAMTADGDGWFSYTFPATAPAANSEFYFASYIPTQFNQTADPANHYGYPSTYNMGFVFLTKGWKEVWIIPNGTNPATITDIPQTKYVVYLFNPWPDNAPMYKQGANPYARMKLVPGAGKCGWYGAYFNTKPTALLFKGLFGAETYGSSGLGSGTAIDLTAQLATKDTVYLNPTPFPGGAPVFTAAAPAGVSGTCSFKYAVTIRDFSKLHPDFEEGPTVMGDVVRKNMVQSTLGPDGKPVKGSAPHFQSAFETWFNTDSSAAKGNLRNYETCRDLTLSKTDGGLWGYDSYNETSHGYYPINDFNKFTETSLSGYQDRATGLYRIGAAYPENKQQNFHFCMEMHATFKYKSGQEFKFIGDDDVWAFIDKKLVIDLGGTHGPQPAEVKLGSLGLVEGQEYPFDFFFCERQTEGSDLLIETSIFFEQQQSVFTKKLVSGTTDTWEVWELISGDKNCGATKGGETKLAISSFQLQGPSVPTPETLPKSVTRYGGITVDPSGQKVSVDTAKVTGLRPGEYSIIYTTESGKGGVVKFTINGSFAVDFINKRENAPAYTGDVSAVTIQTVLNGNPDPRADTVVLKPLAGLTVYSDSAKTLVIAPNTPFVLPANGNKRIYVSADAPGTYTLELWGGKAQAVNMDKETFTFEKQLKVTLSANPAPTNFKAHPFAVTLVPNPASATVYYTIDGSDPTSSPTRQTGKILSLSATTTIKAYATNPGMIDSDIMTFTYTYTPPSVIVKAWYKDVDGDGRIETVVIDFDKAPNTTPTKLSFTIQDLKGANETRTPAAGEIALSGDIVTVKLANPFPYGVTSMTNGGSSGTLSEQADLLVNAGPFAIDDSVAPVIVKAEVIEPDSANPNKRIVLELSENADLPLNSQTAAVFKHEGAEVAAGEVLLKLPSAGSGRNYVLYVDANSNVFPIAGDSVSLNPGEVKDPLGNAPARKAFVKLDGKVPPPKPMDFYVTFPNSTKDTPSSGMEATGEGVFIPIAQSGAALPGSALEGKCVGCVAGDGTAMAGPVFHIVTPGPVEYEFKIFNNLGEFVATGKGRIVAADLGLLKKENGPSGVNYVARVVWTGKTAKGSKAASGAYILQTSLLGAKDSKTGAPGARDTRKVKFGMLRSFRG